MTTTPTTSANERRKFPRYYVGNRMTLAIEDESMRESIGLGEPGDISVGGCRVRNLPACSSVKVGDRLGLLLLDQDDALSLHGQVIHHAFRHLWCRISQSHTHRRTGSRGYY